jgi:hypothetical protein
MVAKRRVTRTKAHTKKNGECVIPGAMPAEVLADFAVEMGRLLTDWQSQPFKLRREGKTFYRHFTTGFRLEFCVSNQQVHPGMVELFCLKRDPTCVFWVDSIHKHPDLVAEIIKLGYDLNWVPESESPDSSPG